MDGGVMWYLKDTGGLILHFGPAVQCIDIMVTENQKPQTQKPGKGPLGSAWRCKRRFRVEHLATPHWAIR